MVYHITLNLLLVLSICIGADVLELPIGFTPEEWENRHLIEEMGYRTDPPQAPVRNIAEYEPMQGVLIRYPFGISTSNLLPNLSKPVPRHLWHKAPASFFIPLHTPQGVLSKLNKNSFLFPKYASSRLILMVC